jgi:hypothetical protein
MFCMKKTTTTNTGAKMMTERREFNNGFNPETIAAEAIEIASRHIVRSTMHDSAFVCLTDAEELFSHKRFDLAIAWALRSLDHSVGVFHPDRSRVEALKKIVA